MTSESTGLPWPIMPRLAPRESHSHKGTFGHALLIGGSLGMAGSISLAARGALRMGAGLVTQAIPGNCLQTAAVLNPSAMSLPLPEDEEGRIAVAALDTLNAWRTKATAIGCGPGLGRSADLQRIVLGLFRSAPQAVVFDADALNNLADSEAWEDFTRHPGERVLTPHPGEWSRLCGVSASDTEAQRAAAVAVARRCKLVIVLKGHQTFVTDGETAYLNTSGTPAMATGGSGDVLTGMITALICQGLNAQESAQLGVYLHGLAGEFAQRQLGSHVVLPQELIDAIPQALAAR
jgi:ADP-dependent NAD(P)H-hydrate dehydratase